MPLFLLYIFVVIHYYTWIYCCVPIYQLTYPIFNALLYRTALDNLQSSRDELWCMHCLPKSVQCFPFMVEPVATIGITWHAAV